VLSSALDDAEFVADEVGENCGSVAAVIIVSFEHSSAQLGQPSDLCVEIVDEQVEVHSVLDGLRFGNALESEVVQPLAWRHKSMELSVVGESDRFLVPQGLFPEGCCRRYVDAVERDSNSPIHECLILNVVY